jgi:hypothetical protein
LLAALYALARTKGAFPCFSRSAVLVLLPASFAALMATLSLFKSTPSARWLIVPAVAAPTILLLFAVALWFPSLRPRVGSFGVNCAIWGSVLLLSALPWLRLVRQAQMDAARQETLKLQQAAQDQIRRAVRPNFELPVGRLPELAAWVRCRDEALAGI